MVLSDPVASALPADAFGRASILSEARSIAQGLQDKGFQPASQPFVPLYKAALAAIAIARRVHGTARLCRRSLCLHPYPVRISARATGSKPWGLMLASLIAIITTLGILASLLFETYRFFTLVSPLEFLTGTDWNPKANVTPVRTMAMVQSRYSGEPSLLVRLSPCWWQFPWIDERDFPDAICQRPCAPLDEAGARNPRRHPDGVPAISPHSPSHLWCATLR